MILKSINTVTIIVNFQNKIIKIKKKKNNNNKRKKKYRRTLGNLNILFFLLNQVYL